MSGQRRLAPWIAGAVALLVVGLIVLLAASPDTADEPTGSPLLGRRAPAITATDTSGKRFDLDEYKGSWVLVNFFATWCAPCKAEQPELVAFADAHAAAKDASVVSVSFNDEPAAVRDFFEKNGGDWPVVAQGNARIALNYGVVKLPESYLVSPTGVVVDKFNGGVTAAAVDRAIAEATASAAPTTAGSKVGS